MLVINVDPHNYACRTTPPMMPSHQWSHSPQAPWKQGCRRLSAPQRFLLCIRHHHPTERGAKAEHSWAEGITRELGPGCRDQQTADCHDLQYRLLHHPQAVCWALYCSHDCRTTALQNSRAVMMWRWNITCKDHLCTNVKKELVVDFRKNRCPIVTLRIGTKKAVSSYSYLGVHLLGHFIWGWNTS